MAGVGGPLDVGDGLGLGDAGAVVVAVADVDGEAGGRRWWWCRGCAEWLNNGDTGG
jgi:hypothetical protein